MNTLFPSALLERLAAARLCLITALLALLVGGVVSAAMAHAPSRDLMWMVAYLVLVAGVAQAVFGLGQTLLPERLPAVAWRVSAWAFYNLGNVGVILGTLTGLTWVVTVGTALFLVALVLFLFGVIRARGGKLLHAYQGLLAVICLGALTGLVLSLLGVGR